MSEASAAILRLASAAAGSGSLEDRRAYFEALEAADVAAIAEALPGMGSTGVTGAMMEGCREAARAVIEEKLTRKHVEALRALERVGAALAIVAIVIGVPSAVAAVVQLWRGCP